MIKTRGGVGRNKRGETMAVRPLGSQHNTLITAHLSSVSSAHPRCPKTSSQNLKIILYLSGFSHFHFPLVLLCPVSPSVSSPVSLTLPPSCCLLYLLRIDPLAVTLGFSLALSASQRGIYEDKCDPTDARYLFSSQSQSATM